MAAIDKLYMTDYSDFDYFRTWVIIHKPSLLNNIYSPFDNNWVCWSKRKDDMYNNNKLRIKTFFSNYPTKESYFEKNKWASNHDWESMVELKHDLESEDYRYNIKLPVANFTLKQDRWLFYHCPIDSIREYLTNQCGYKEKWYHKILFKLTLKHYGNY